MVWIVALLSAGMAFGAFIISREKSERILRAAGLALQISTAALLLFMGLWLGSNPEFWNNIRSIGLRGMLFALVCTAGSVAVVYFLTRSAFKEEEKP